jgi:mannose-6-phosphate isomerase-like protein (cupin superfamily)
MIIKKNKVNPIEFDGLKIFDYTSDTNEKSSFAVIDVPSGTAHKLSWSKRSDKYYFIISGEIVFTINGKEVILGAGDFCLIKKGEQFKYTNDSGRDAQLVLVHTPNFDINEEVFE